MIVKFLYPLFWGILFVNSLVYGDTNTIEVDKDILSLDTIEASYNKEIKAVKGLKGAIERNIVKSDEVMPMVAEQLKSQTQKTIMAKNFTSISSLASKQTGNLADSQSHRANAVNMRNKQVIYDLMYQNRALSKEEISETFYKK